MDKRDKIIWLVLLVALIAFPAVGLSRYLQRVSSLIFIYMILALSLNIITGYMGQVSLGHAAFYAIGAYTSSLLSEHFGWNFLLTCVCAVVMTGFIGWLFSIPTMKLSGTYLAIITMGFGEIIKVLIVNWESLTHGTYGVQRIAKPEFFGLELKTTNNGMYYLCLVFLVLAVLFCIAIERSKLGRTLRAIKDDPLAASLMGIELSHYKRLAFTLSTALAGAAGALYAHLSGYIDANSFNSDVSTMILSIVIFGGMGSIKGMILGAAILVSFPEVFRFVAEYRFVVYGLILILMMVFRTDGLLGGNSKRPYTFPRFVKVKEGEVKSDGAAGGQ
jgi:branched-chain amino acid transport system permease protein